MKNIFFFLLLLPLWCSAQVLDADALLDKVIHTMKADAPLQMDYSYTVYEDDNSIVMQDKGVMRLEGNRYSLIMDKMGLWCNGETQWSYMQEIDEIYITDAMSDEAQNLSPLFIMENYREGCTKEVEIKDGKLTIVLHVPADSDIEKVVLSVDSGSSRLTAMDVFMRGQGYMEVKLDGYHKNCVFASDIYECPVKEYSTAEIVDMR